MGINLSKVDDVMRIKANKISRHSSSKKIDISMIGNPTDFRHTYHVGSDSVRSEIIITSDTLEPSKQHTPKTDSIPLSTINDSFLIKKESALSLATEPTISDNTFIKNSSDAIFKDVVDAKLSELISKRPTRTRVLNGNLYSNKPRLMI
ncbi:hypothetical protein G6F56_009712 [Rhizopus delemar]|nr:hypothetical protein G6F56_009712 [Rhizopus delemar]